MASSITTSTTFNSSGASNDPLLRGGARPPAGLVSEFAAVRDKVPAGGSSGTGQSASNGFGSGGTLLAASPKGSPNNATGAAEGTATAGGQGTLYSEPETIELFASPRWKGKEFLLYQTHNLDTDNWEVRLHSARGGKWVPDTLAFESERKVEPEDFGVKGPLWSAVRESAEELAAPSNERGTIRPDPGKGTGWDTVVGATLGALSDLVGLVAGIPEDVADLGTGLWNTALRIGEGAVDGARERLDPDFDGTRGGANNPINEERALRGLTDPNATRALIGKAEKAIAQGLRANTETSSYKLGTVLGPLLLGAKTQGAPTGAARLPGNLNADDVAALARKAPVGEINRALANVSDDALRAGLGQNPQIGRALEGSLRLNAKSGSAATQQATAQSLQRLANLQAPPAPQAPTNVTPGTTMPGSKPALAPGTTTPGTATSGATAPKPAPVTSPPAASPATPPVAPVQATAPDNGTFSADAPPSSAPDTTLADPPAPSPVTDTTPPQPLAQTNRPQANQQTGQQAGAQGGGDAASRADEAVQPRVAPTVAAGNADMSAQEALDAMIAESNDRRASGANAEAIRQLREAGVTVLALNEDNLAKVNPAPTLKIETLEGLQYIPNPDYLTSDDDLVGKDGLPSFKEENGIPGTASLVAAVMYRHGKTNSNAGEDMRAAFGPSTIPDAEYRLWEGKLLKKGTKWYAGNKLNDHVRLLDPSLQNALGQQQSFGVLKGELDISQVYSSPVNRALDTARIVTDGATFNGFTVVPGLAERGVGDMFGYPKLAEVKEIVSDPKFVPPTTIPSLQENDPKPWDNSPDATGPESEEIFRARINRTAEDMAGRLDELGNSAIFSHQYTTSFMQDAWYPMTEPFAKNAPMGPPTPEEAAWEQESPFSMYDQKVFQDAMTAGHHIPNGQPLVRVGYVWLENGVAQFKPVPKGYSGLDLVTQLENEMADISEEIGALREKGDPDGLLREKEAELQLSENALEVERTRRAMEQSGFQPALDAYDEIYRRLNTPPSTP